MKFSVFGSTVYVLVLTGFAASAPIDSGVVCTEKCTALTLVAKDKCLESCGIVPASINAKAADVMNSSGASCAKTCNKKFKGKKKQARHLGNIPIEHEGVRKRNIVDADWESLLSRDDVRDLEARGPRRASVNAHAADVMNSSAHACAKKCIGANRTACLESCGVVPVDIQHAGNNKSKRK